ncbi:BZ3500_MvSof-1268-A1-R1_Chr5-3g08162 [Microbotryum saponariae]|uniref:BZ3500_MvSof-1268-A1-R1_Chr5-3g08162 protein n=1 Tax=Microbotryum saponariae TaxID=289078 RepID=A0A2X0KL31_9BASI|nr:BZ3500_MvSof-1268-A1-R1_Chr5-3g08162 [Microbotryum saponariae]SDA07921.1 BZ3501_MvSof-1269-A2-R1_Chr5-1g07306 [Microbotryum saponariae]
MIPPTFDLLIRTGSTCEGGGRLGIVNMMRSTAIVDGGVVPLTRRRLLIDGWRKSGEGAHCLLRTMMGSDMVLLYRYRMRCAREGVALDRT